MSIITNLTWRPIISALTTEVTAVFPSTLPHPPHYQYKKPNIFFKKLIKSNQFRVRISKGVFNRHDRCSTLGNTQIMKLLCKGIKVQKKNQTPWKGWLLARELCVSVQLAGRENSTESSSGIHDCIFLLRCARCWGYLSNSLTHWNWQSTYSTVQKYLNTFKLFFPRDDCTSEVCKNKYTCYMS